jgi:hypothetical protein
MKAIRLTLISIVAVASASASFAGPGIQYWNARRADRAAAKVEVTTPAVTSEKCKTMTVTQGNLTRTVPCTGAVAETAKCKAMCGS